MVKGVGAEMEKEVEAMVGDLVVESVEETEKEALGEE